MARLRLSALARMDLLGIAAYTRERWGTVQALRYAKQLEEGFARLEKMPQTGHQLPGLDTRYRRLQVGKHVVFYREQANCVFIVRVLHERMLPAKHLRESG